jgi:hypothetical protein
VVAFLAEVLISADAGLVLDTLAIHVRRPADPRAYPLLDEIERRLARALARGELHDGLDAHQAAILFLSNVFGFLVAHATACPPRPKPALLVDAFLSGVTARRGPRAARPRRKR